MNKLRKLVLFVGTNLDLFIQGLKNFDHQFLIINFQSLSNFFSIISPKRLCATQNNVIVQSTVV